jgi:hypothetical protein
MIEISFTAFSAFLAILWFLIYWILGGVFFAVIAILRLGRIRKVRFSCLFSILAFICGVAASIFGLSYSQEAVDTCLLEAATKAEVVTSVFGCGFAGVFGAFMLGAVVLTIGGFIIMTLSKSQTKPWLVLHDEEEEEAQEVEKQERGGSEFF